MGPKRVPTACRSLSPRLTWRVTRVMVFLTWFRNGSWNRSGKVTTRGPLAQGCLNTWCVRTRRCLLCGRLLSSLRNLLNLVICRLVLFLKVRTRRTLTRCLNLVATLSKLFIKRVPLRSLDLIRSWRMRRTWLVCHAVPLAPLVLRIGRLSIGRISIPIILTRLLKRL